MTRRNDRYCTELTARMVLKYISERSDSTAKMFRVPGFHRAKFKNDLLLLAEVPETELYKALNYFCIQYDKSEKKQFSTFKARIRRYIFNQRSKNHLVVSADNYNALIEIKEKQKFLSIDETLSEMISLWNFENREL